MFVLDCGAPLRGASRVSRVSDVLFCMHGLEGGLCGASQSGGAGGRLVRGGWGPLHFWRDEGGHCMGLLQRSEILWDESARPAFVLDCVAQTVRPFGVRP